MVDNCKILLNSINCILFTRRRLPIWYIAGYGWEGDVDVEMLPEFSADAECSSVCVSAGAGTGIHRN